MKCGPEVAELCARILETGQPAAQMIIVEACCRHLRPSCGGDSTVSLPVHKGFVLELLVSVMRQRIFGPNSIGSELRRLFLRRISLATLLANQPLLLSCLAQLAGMEIVRCTGELTEFGHLYSTVSGLADLLQFLAAVSRQHPCQLFLESASRAALLGLLAASYGGGTAKLKVAVCDLIAAELGRPDKEQRCGDISDFLPVLGSIIVNYAQSWQLRDSAIQV